MGQDRRQDRRQDRHQDKHRVSRRRPRRVRGTSRRPGPRLGQDSRRRRRRRTTDGAHDPLHECQSRPPHGRDFLLRARCDATCSGSRQRPDAHHGTSECRARTRRSTNASPHTSDERLGRDTRTLNLDPNTEPELQLQSQPQPQAQLQPQPRLNPRSKETGRHAAPGPQLRPRRDDPCRGLSFCPAPAHHLPDRWDKRIAQGQTRWPATLCFPCCRRRSPRA